MNITVFYGAVICVCQANSVTEVLNLQIPYGNVPVATAPDPGPCDITRACVLFGAGRPIAYHRITTTIDHDVVRPYKQAVRVFLS